MKTYSIMSTGFELIDYLTARDNLTAKQRKYLLNTLNYCINHNADSFTALIYGGEYIFIDTALADFMTLYDIKFKEIIENNLCKEVHFNN